MSRLLNYLPPYEQESEVFQEIMKAMEAEFDELFFDIEDLDKQFSPDTATWGLAILEKELGLPINPDLDIYTRRSLIKSRLLMQPPGSKDKLTTILRSFAESAKIEEIFGEYRFRVLLSTNDEIGRNMSHIYSVLETSKPAHLDYEITLKFKQKNEEISFKSITALGESVTLYPLIKTSLSDKLNTRAANTLYSSDAITMYPEIETELTYKLKAYNSKVLNSSDNTVIYPRIAKAIENKSRASAAMNNNNTEIIIICPKE